jgi:L-fuculose-phosphate aldolase
MKFNGSSSVEEDIIAAGRLLWDKGLVTGYNGNLSARTAEGTVCITGAGTAIGDLAAGGLSYLTADGGRVKGAEPSSERGVHLAIYQAFPETLCVAHTHTPYINGFFMDHDIFVPETFEAELYLGRVRGIIQSRPNVTDFPPVIEALRLTPVVALCRHGVIAMGRSFYDAISLVQYLEEAIKTAFIRRGFRPM